MHDADIKTMGSAFGIEKEIFSETCTLLEFQDKKEAEAGMSRIAKNLAQEHDMMQLKLLV